MSSKKQFKRNRRIAREQEKNTMSAMQQQMVPIDRLWASIGKLHLQVESQAEMLGLANREIQRLSNENARLLNKYEPAPKPEPATAAPNGEASAASA
jgi:hypothetical protein